MRTGWWLGAATQKRRRSNPIRVFSRLFVSVIYHFAIIAITIHVFTMPYESIHKSLPDKTILGRDDTAYVGVETIIHRDLKLVYGSRRDAQFS